MNKLLLCLLLSLAVSGEESKERSREKSPDVEAEYVASDVFRSGTLIVKIFKELHLEGEYFGAPEYDNGIVGASWKLKWRALSLSPGFAVGFGGQADTVPMLTLRWNLETRRWFSQGFFGQSLSAHTYAEAGGKSTREPETRVVYASVLDNNHVSVRLGPVEAGGLWEHVAYREDNEWKGGLRLAVRIKERFKLIFQCVGPGVEYRGGVAFEK